MILRGRGISGGIGEGPVISITSPVSFSRDIEPGSGRLLIAGLGNANAAGKVLALPRAEDAGSEALADLKRSDRAPAALIMQECSPHFSARAVSSNIPVTDRVDVDLLLNGDWTLVMGSEGRVELRGVELVPAVTSFLRLGDRVLIVKRSDKVATSKGKWAGVSGYMEEGEMPEDTAVKEIIEETGFKNPRHVATGDVVLVRAGPVVWEIHPFLFDVDSSEVTLDWEHTEYRWILPEELERYDTVPKLGRALGNVLEGYGPALTPRARHVLFDIPDEHS